MALLVLAIIIGTVTAALMPVSAAPTPQSPGPTPPGTRTPYELNIEVDHFEGLLWPEVIEAFDFLVTYFEDRGIQTTVDFNSTNNVIEGDGYLGTPSSFGGNYLGSLNAWRSINLRHHDRQATHIHFIVARDMGAGAGRAYPPYGAGISLDILGRDYENIRFAVMRWVGNCIGIGAQDYASSPDGFMASYDPETAGDAVEYLAEDWESAFAPDGAFDDSDWSSARIWNRFSVTGEIYDATSDVIGRATGNLHTQLYLREIGGTNEFIAVLSYIDGTYAFSPVEPGNYTLEVMGYRLDGPAFVNVSEREILQLDDVRLQLAQPPEPLEPLPDYRMAYLLAAALASALLVLAFAIRARRKNKERAKRRIMVATTLAVVLLLALAAFYWGQNPIYNAVTVNEFLDDIIDRNGDGVLNAEDHPLDWHSYGAGDRVVVRDRIDYLFFDSSTNSTHIKLVGYTGDKWEWGVGDGNGYVYIMIKAVPDDVTGKYSPGDAIIVETRMLQLRPGDPDSPIFLYYWTLVK